MLVRRYIVSMLALAGLAAAGSLAFAGAKAKIPVKPASAEEIAEAWRYNPEEVKEENWQGVAPKDSHKLYVQMGRLTGVSFEGAWNFYAQKCGSDKKYGETFNFVGAQTKDGQYVIQDGKREGFRTTIFAFTNERFSVSVQLRQASDKDKIYIAITVATR